MSNTKDANSPNPVIATYDNHAAAEATIKALSSAGFDTTKLSIVGKGYQTEEHALGFYTLGDRVRAWGGAGSFWGAIWGVLAGPAVFVIPYVGLIAVAGPLVVALVAALEGAAVVGGMSALGAALYGMGISKDEAIKYEADVKANHFLVLVHGSDRDIAKAKAVLATLPEAKHLSTATA